MNTPWQSTTAMDSARKILVLNKNTPTCNHLQVKLLCVLMGGCSRCPYHNNGQHHPALPPNFPQYFRLLSVIGDFWFLMSTKDFHADNSPIYDRYSTGKSL